MKASYFTLSEAAEADILEQSDWYTDQSGRELAERWDKAVTSTMLRLLENPLSGALCNFQSSDLRDVRRLPVAGFPKHLIFYQASERELFVLRIVHGARDLESLF